MDWTLILLGITQAILGFTLLQLLEVRRQQVRDANRIQALAAKAEKQRRQLIGFDADFTRICKMMEGHVATDCEQAEQLNRILKQMIQATMQNDLALLRQLQEVDLRITSEHGGH